MLFSVKQYHNRDRSTGLIAETAELSEITQTVLKVGRWAGCSI